ncbi:unknown [Firmicutes bacterium CAG:129]|nr:unknown [Firmicutes bacterium CAG:129]
MDDLSAILASIFSSGTFNEMLRRATPVALAAIGGRSPPSAARSPSTPAS